MIRIYKITSDPCVDFAAEELKKYLRMMDPDGGEIPISYAPQAKDGFRLGLMQDFSLDVSDAEDTALDDILYMDTTEEGGILAGDNPRSVLLAVYEFLRQNGCRWLFPGVDGEYIPLHPVRGVRQRIKPSCRYRGPCIEGAVSQQILLETLDFIPKVGMNLFMMQFFRPSYFYHRYYNHGKNPLRRPEPITEDTVRQWKAACEAEMSKRGIQFHDVGHGLTVAPFGIEEANGWSEVKDEDLPPKARPFLALLNGKRGLYGDITINTQFCMSNPEARRKVAEYVAEYSARHTNVDYLHVWLGDAIRNHCECEECAKKTVSDQYVMLLNDIDRALSEKRLSTRIVFIMYTDTTWAPVEERIEHPARFTMMLAPIARSYTQSMSENRPATVPFVRNQCHQPKTLDAFMSYYEEWRKVWQGAGLALEYHFWQHQFLDPSGLSLARLIFDDVTAYKKNGVNGLIACGSQRSYFPCGFAYYVFARKQFDVSLSFEELATEYFSCAFGEDGQAVYRYLWELSSLLSQDYLEGKASADPQRSPYYCPQRADALRRVPELLSRGRDLIRAHDRSCPRIQTVSMALLAYHADYCERLAKALIPLAEGDRDAAEERYAELCLLVQENEPILERYFDQDLFMDTFHSHFKK